MSLPLMLFFGIGAQTFVRPREKALAAAIFWFGAALLALSLATLFLPRLATADLIAVLAASVVYLALWLFARRRKPPS